MKIESVNHNGQLKLYFDGELDHHAAKKAMQSIEEYIDSVLPRNLVLYFKNLSFMDSSGIAIIVKSYRKINALGGKFSIENVGKQPLRVLDASGIERLVNITATAKE